MRNCFQIDDAPRGCSRFAGRRYCWCHSCNAFFCPPVHHAIIFVPQNAVRGDTCAIRRGRRITDTLRQISRHPQGHRHTHTHTHTHIHTHTPMTKAHLCVHVHRLHQSGTICFVMWLCNHILHKNCSHYIWERWYQWRLIEQSGTQARPVQETLKWDVCSIMRRKCVEHISVMLHGRRRRNEKQEILTNGKKYSYIKKSLPLREMDNWPAVETVWGLSQWQMIDSLAALMPAKCSLIMIQWRIIRQKENRLKIKQKKKTFPPRSWLKSYYPGQVVFSVKWFCFCLFVSQRGLREKLLKQFVCPG